MKLKLVAYAIAILVFLPFIGLKAQPVRLLSVSPKLGGGSMVITSSGFPAYYTGLSLKFRQQLIDSCEISFNAFYIRDLDQLFPPQTPKAYNSYMYGLTAEYESATAFTNSLKLLFGLGPALLFNRSYSDISETSAGISVHASLETNLNEKTSGGIGFDYVATFLNNNPGYYSYYATIRFSL